MTRTLPMEYRFIAPNGSPVGPYRSVEDARLIGGADAPIEVREVGPWLDYSDKH